MSIINISPHEIAKSMLPGLKALAQQKVEQAVIDAVIPHIRETLQNFLKGGRVDVDHNPVTNEIRFLCRIDYDDYTGNLKKGSI